MGSRQPISDIEEPSGRKSREGPCGGDEPEALPLSVWRPECTGSADAWGLHSESALLPVVLPANLADCGTVVRSWQERRGCTEASLCEMLWGSREWGGAGGRSAQGRK